MLQKKNIPQLRFPEFKVEWERKKLGDISEKINSGKTPLGGESVYSEKGILFIRSQNVTGDRLSYENSTFISAEINSTMKNSVVKPNDILLNITGASLGRSCVVPEDFGTGNVNQHVCIIRIDKNNEPYFIQPILSSEKGQNLFTSLQTGSGREGLNFQSIRKIELYFPTLPEQKRIASFFTAIDKRITKLKQKKSLLEQYKKGVTQKLFSQELRFKDDIGQNFQEWEQKKLGDIAEVKRGAASQHLRYITDATKGIRLLRINDFLSNDAVYVEDTIDIKRFRVKTNDLLIAGTGATAGIIFIVPEKFNDMSFSYNAPRIRVTNAYHTFIYYYLKSDIILKEQQRLFVGNAQPFLDTDSMRSFKINLPSLIEQIKIANFLSTIDKKINSTQLQINKTEDYKKGLLQKMFC